MFPSRKFSCAPLVEAARVHGCEPATGAGEADLDLLDANVTRDLAPGFAPGDYDIAIRPEGLAGVGEDVEFQC